MNTRAHVGTVAMGLWALWCACVLGACGSSEQATLDAEVRSPGLDAGGAPASDRGNTPEGSAVKDENGSASRVQSAAGSPKSLTDKDWKQRLSAEQFYVLRQKGTERPFTNKYWKTDEPGVYKCAGCSAVLFTSEDKFYSDCGWPSFDKAASRGAVEFHDDTTHGMRRIEVTCKACGGHLGHVFNDGPTDTGLRYCINSVSIELEKAPASGQGAEPGAGPQSQSAPSASTTTPTTPAPPAHP